MFYIGLGTANVMHENKIGERPLMTSDIRVGRGPKIAPKWEVIEKNKVGR